MTFSRAQSQTPTSIGVIEVTLSDDGENKSASYRIHIRDQNGGEFRIQGDIGDLVPHLTQADISWLIDFMTRLRTKATTEFLG